MLLLTQEEMDCPVVVENFLLWFHQTGHLIAQIHSHYPMEEPGRPRDLRAGPCQHPENKDRHAMLKLRLWILLTKPEKEDKKKRREE